MGIYRIISHSLAGLCFILIFSNAAFSQMKIGIIDGDVILASLKESKEVQTQLDTKKREWQLELERMNGELDRLGKEYESQRLLLSDEKEQEKIAQIQQLDKKMKEYYNEKFNQLNGEFFRIQNQLMEPILKNVQTTIDKIATEENYDYIFNSSLQIVVYISEDVKQNHDLTKRIVEEMGGSLPGSPSPGSNSKSN